MSPRSWPERVRDILDAIAEIQGFVAGRSFDEFAADPRTLKAVLADFSIVGEAAARIPAEVQAAHPAVPWRRMREMRNIIVHVYFAVNPRIVWDTVHNDLPPLIPMLEAMIAAPRP